MIVLDPGATTLTLGHLAALLTAIGGATAAIVVRKIGSEERPVVMLIYPMVVNIIVMAALLPLVYEDLRKLAASKMANENQTRMR